ncbi:MAG TPA: TadE family protein [Candidatus Dormibacteraeota bacterium]|nr:TadE family protein [Candidatus Dormibacteraeota bacterium]
MTRPPRLSPGARPYAGCRSGRQGGQGLVEFALIAPIFFAILMVTIEAGLLMNAQITLDNATREAARVAALCGNTKGAWSNFSGAPAGGSSCDQAVRITLNANLGILPVVSGGNPDHHLDTPTDSANSACQASGVAYDGAPQGCPIVLSTSYTYTFLLGFVLGPAAPRITLSSQAHVVSQR